MSESRSEIRDGIQIDWDAVIEMDDGVIIRADVFRPVGDDKYPVIISYGPYAKNLSFQEGYKSQWTRLVDAVPEVLEGSSNLYQNWELVDPEIWVPDGYALVRVDSRGTGCSPGIVDPWSPRETKDFHDCIEWAGTQAWSNGKVGINGISYYSMNQWQVAATRPPHLAALCIWEGSNDHYREVTRHGGILSQFVESWYRRQVASVQYGLGEKGGRSPVHNDLVTGPETLSEDQLAANQRDIISELQQRKLDDDYYKDHSGAPEKIEVPLLSAGNWGGQGLHPRGNIEGYLAAGSKQKWLEMHGDTHFTLFYAKQGEDLQKRFFGHFLKGEDTGWEDQPPVELQVRYPDETFVRRAESEWPLARTQWTKFYPNSGTNDLSNDEPTSTTTLTYETTSDGLFFSTPPMTEPIELTGPVAAKLWVSSDTTDADLFLALRVMDPDDKEVTFIGSNDPRTPVGLGWLRASQRKLDATKSEPYRPWHSHDESQPLTPGEPVELDIEIWPTSIVIPPEYRLVLNVRGKDYEVDGTVAYVPHSPYPMKGVGPFLHEDSIDRPADIFGGKNTLHFAPGKMPYLLLPVIPDANLI
jgi:predicted acyl esterase